MHISASSSLHKKNALFLAVLFVAFSAFTVDVIDLREELQILPCPNGCLDNNVTTCITSNVAFEAEPVFISCSVFWKSSVKVSFLHLLPCGFRAPPFVS